MTPNPYRFAPLVVPPRPPWWRRVRWPDRYTWSAGVVMAWTTGVALARAPWWAGCTLCVFLTCPLAAWLRQRARERT